MTGYFRKKFSDAVEILEIIEENNFEAYFVGGCVRDYILNKDFHDIDITTSARPEEIKKIFEKTIDTGIKHGTVTVKYKKKFYEITTFRSEENYIDHRRPEKVEFIRDLKKDLERRDFTINAIALDKLGNIIDFHNGTEDLKSKIINTVNDPYERFNEDALRMLRAFRFSSQLNFDISTATFEAIRKNASLIRHISVERITSEFKKMFLGENITKSFEMLLSSKLNLYMPVFKLVKKANLDNNNSFEENIFLLCDQNNINISELKLLKLSNHSVKLIKDLFDIKESFLNKENINIILYKHRVENVIFINNYFKFLKSDISNINLAIKSFEDVDISVHEIISIFPDKKKGPWISKLQRSVENYILRGELLNNETEIKKFLRMNGED